MNFRKSSFRIPNVAFSLSERLDAAKLSHVTWSSLIPSIVGHVPPGVNPEAHQWFQSVDSDHSGFINLKELKQALLNSNWSSFNDETCLMMISEWRRVVRRKGKSDLQKGTPDVVICLVLHILLDSCVPATIQSVWLQRMTDKPWVWPPLFKAWAGWMFILSHVSLRHVWQDTDGQNRRVWLLGAVGLHAEVESAVSAVRPRPLGFYQCRGAAARYVLPAWLRVLTVQTPLLPLCLPSSALAHMGYNLSPQFSQTLVQRFSVRGGRPGMQLDRFIQVCTQLQSTTQFFRERDTAMSGNIRVSYEDFLSGAITRLMWASLHGQSHSMCMLGFAVFHHELFFKGQSDREDPSVSISMV